MTWAYDGDYIDRAQALIGEHHGARAVTDEAALFSPDDEDDPSDHYAWPKILEEMRDEFRAAAKFFTEAADEADRRIQANETSPVVAEPENA